MPGIMPRMGLKRSAVKKPIGGDVPETVAGLKTKDLTPAAFWVPVDVVKRWDRNPRKNAAAVPPTKKSIEEYGFGAPIVARVKDGEIIAGDTRIQAAIELGMTHIPVRFMDLPKKKAERLALADNRAGEFASWDDSMLYDLLKEYNPTDLSNVGFSDEDLGRLETKFNPSPPDEFPSVSREVHTEYKCPKCGYEWS